MSRKISKLILFFIIALGILTMGNIALADDYVGSTGVFEGVNLNYIEESDKYALTVNDKGGNGQYTGTRYTISVAR